MREDLIPLKEQLKVFKKEKKDKIEIEELEGKIAGIEKEIKEQETIVSDIDARVFDLKAVNPNSVLKVDTRTTLEVIENIETQSKIVADAMAKLKMLLNQAVKSKTE